MTDPMQDLEEARREVQKWARRALFWSTVAFVCAVTSLVINIVAG